MNNISERNVHLKRFLLIILFIFTLVLFTHLYVLVKDITISIEGFALPTMSSILAVFVSASMVVMSMYYYRSIK